jgi:alpha-methylacyl-CoA racemase
MAGVLEGFTVIEMAGLGPVPFTGMMLADHGARVIRISRPAPGPVLGLEDSRDIMSRSRERIALDLHEPDAVARVRALAATSDALIEGFRPGVMERLGLGPDTLLEDNPRLVYGRMTGWGQDGPLAHRAGHDINYIALSGALHGYGRAGGKPTPPLNAVGDIGGGGMLLAFAVVAALLNVQRSGTGQVIDCAMVEGAALVAAPAYTLYGNGVWRDERGVNALDTGAHFYETYETADGKWVAVGPLEPKFYALLLDKTGLGDEPAFAKQFDPARWPELKQKLAAVFATRTRDAWCAALEGTDVCFAPVLGLAEAPHHPHNRARGSFVEEGGLVQPAPAPRFSATPAPPVSLAGR